MALIPSYVVVDSVVFPLAADERGVWLDTTRGEPRVINLIVSTLLQDRQGDARLVELLQHQRFVAPEIAASPITPELTLKVLDDGPINWKRLSGELPELEDAYLLGASFEKEMLVIPRKTLIGLVEQVGALNDQVLAGTLEPRIDESMPIPRRPPPTPDVAEHDRLRATSEGLAQEFREMLANLPPGEEWVPSPPEPEEPDEEHEETWEPDVPIRIPDPPMRPAPAGLASDAILREIEVMANALEPLDEQARRSEPEPYQDQALEAQVVAKRRRLLFELDVAGVLSPEHAESAHPRLVTLGLVRLVGYHDAAMEMHRYFTSPGRARRVRKAAPACVLDSDISLDWFRVPSGYVAADLDPHDWLVPRRRGFDRLKGRELFGRYK